MTLLHDIIANKSKGKVNVAGRVTFQGDTETIQSNGKTLNKQEAVLTDESGSIRLVLWQSDITRVRTGSTYEFTRALVKTYQTHNYITLNRQTAIKETEIAINRSDDELIDNHVNKVCCPADGVEKVTTYLACKKCNASFPLYDERKVLQCANCGCAQLRAKCTGRTIVKALFVKEQERVSLTIFDDKLSALYNLYKNQANVTKPFTDLTEEDIMELLLNVEATLFYNNKLSIISVKCKED